MSETDPTADAGSPPPVGRDDSDAEAPVRRELRLALAIRGGVSLAIWMGGACAEIDQLRRSGEGAGSEPAEGFWGDLLPLSAYRSVIVDVIAGASAGGLNGVLLAASQHYGFRLDDVRQLWVEVGGLEKLVREVDPRLSVLDGDRSFLGPLHEELRERALRGDPPERAPRIDLQLAATLVEGIDRPARSTEDEALVERRFMSRFHFSHRPGTPWARSDFPLPAGEGDPEFEAAMWRLALAARSTSSFPVAFEPAVIRSSRPESFGNPPPHEPGPLVDMRGVFTDVRGNARSGDDLEPEDFVVSDGGILDNIPMGKALSAIAEAPADQPTGRYLVYLHPNGPSTAASVEEGADAGAAAPAGATSAVGRADRLYRRSAVNVLTGTMQARMSAETTLGDVRQLEEHNGAVLQARTIRAGTCARMAALGDQGVPTLVAYAAGARGQYVRQRQFRDALLVRGLLDDPIGVLGTDEFPRTVAGTVLDDDRWRSPLAAWTPAARARLTPDLLTYMGRVEGDELDVSTFTRGCGPLERVLTLLVEWARRLDEATITTGGGPTAAGACRGRLYDVLAFVRHALGTPRDLGWVARGATGDWDPRESAAAVDALAAVTRQEADEIAAAIASLSTPTPDAGALDAFARRTLDRLDRLAAEGPAVADAADVDVRAALVTSVIVPIVEELSGIHRGLYENGVPAADPGYLFDQLAREPDVVRALAALEVAGFEEFVSGVPGSTITFTRLSATNRTPLAEDFAALGAGGGPVWKPGSGSPEFVRGIDPQHKLAGNELKNFAAFVRPEWRENDWMWGRLDAVPTLVDLLVTAPTVRTWLRESGRDTLDAAREAVRDLAMPGDEEELDDCVRRTWDRAADAIDHELSDILAGDPARARRPVDGIREVLVARRQWEIVRSELAPAPGSSISEVVAAHSVGRDTLTEPKKQETADLFGRVSDAVGLTLVSNVDAVRDRNRPSGSKDLVDRPTRIAAALVQRAGRLASALLLAPRPIWRTLLAPAVALLLALAAAVAMVFTGWQVALVIGVVLVVAIAVGIVALLRLRRPAPPGRRSPG